MKGYQTTEFWVTLMGAAVGLFLLSYGALKDKDTPMYVGGSLFVASGGAYAVSRGIAKGGSVTSSSSAAGNSAAGNTASTPPAGP